MTPQEHAELLARIDERTKGIDSKLSDHIQTVKEHIGDDEDEFRSIKGRINWLIVSFVVIAMIVGGPGLVTSFIK